MTVHWTKTAAQDLRLIARFIFIESPASARGSLSALERSALRLRRFSLRGRIVPELKEQGILVYRELIRAPWRIIYRIEDRKVLVLAVIDGRGNLEDLLLERFLR